MAFRPREEEEIGGWKLAPFVARHAGGVSEAASGKEEIKISEASAMCGRLRARFS